MAVLELDRRVARSRRLSDAPRVAWWAQTGVLIGVAAVVFFLIAGLHSSLNVHAPTPAAAAAAVSPLQLASKEPVKQPFDATLPALQSGQIVTLDIDVVDKAVEIASGVTYQAWPYFGSVPGKTIRVRAGPDRQGGADQQGDGAPLDRLPLGIHAAQPELCRHHAGRADRVHVRGRGAGGVFVYHCGTPPANCSERSISTPEQREELKKAGYRWKN